MLSTAFLLFIVTDSKAQIYVSKIPVAPKYTIPRKPSKYFVWISDEWIPTLKKYIYEKGHWSYPPTDNAVWVNGFWRKEDKGYVRVNGHWDYNPKK